ncbi:integrin alpha-2-like [Alosa alosa]|uniref:integrin alpha-2-like n=1 Tax=Alosa alosa TaxID=278164 RepID=UPI00201514E8|nr:integrin alpha-2-like [Alosa alosa]
MDAQKIQRGSLIPCCQSFNVGTSGAKVFSGPAVEEFGYTVQQFTNHLGKWLLVGSPWSGTPDNKKGDIYKCEIAGPGSNCERLNLQNSVTIPGVENINVNMSLGSIITQPTNEAFMTCGPLWAQRCGSHYFYPGVCAEVSAHFSPLQAFSPAHLNCGPVDIMVVLDGSDSIYPWPSVVAFLKKLLENLEIGPDKTQVSVMQYAVDTSFEFRFNSYGTKESMLAAVSNMPQKRGDQTNTFSAIQFASEYAFLPQYGGRPGATKVMVVVSDGESNDKLMRDQAIAACEQEDITRFSIAVLGYYNRNNIDPKILITEMESIASTPTERHYFHVAAEEALLEIAGTLGDRIFNIEGVGKGEDFQMEFAQVGFSAHQTSKEGVVMLGAVGAYGWSGTVVHQKGQTSDVLPEKAFESILENKNHSSYIGYSVTSLRHGSTEYFVAGAPRANHSGLVVVYTLDSSAQASIIDTQRGTQVGSYFGSVLCPLDVDKDGVTDVLLVGAPMFMSEDKKETGKVYVFSITNGILGDQGFLVGPSAVENARFGMAISAVPDLNLDGFSDVVVGAPLEDNSHGVIYIYFGDKTTIRLHHSQRIMGVKVDPALQYFGRSLDGSGDLNGDTIPDISVGAYGKVVQLWSRGIVVVTAEVSSIPERVSILNRTCSLRGRMASCFKAKVCFTAQLRSTVPMGPAAITYTIILDADLQSSRVSSRGQFSNSERIVKKDIHITTQPLCEDHIVYVQDSSDLMNLFALRLDIALQASDSNPVLDVFSTTAWDFFIPFSKDCGTDDVCVSDLQLRVWNSGEQLSSSPMLVSQKNRRLSFMVSVTNKKENAYNARVSATFSKNLFYASITQPNNVTEVKCTSTGEFQNLSCQVGSHVLMRDQTVTFEMIFDFNTDQLLRKAQVTFEAQSDSEEENPTDNVVHHSIPVQYNSEIIFTREADMSFYVVDKAYQVRTEMTSYEDVGPEFNFMLKVSTGNFPVSLVYLTISLPIKTLLGNPLLYLTGVTTAPSSNVSCDVNGVLKTLKKGRYLHSPTFMKESFKGIDSLDCNTSQCQTVTCVLKDTVIKSHYFVNVTTRIWNSTFALASFQALSLSVSADIETDIPDLLVITDKHCKVKVTIIKSGGKGDIPFVIIVGSVLGGLLLLVIVTSTLWTLGFFKRKHKQLSMTGKNETD